MDDTKKRERILVLDLDDWCQEFLSSVIKMLGCDFFLVTSVPVALEMISREFFDLLITDIKVPDFPHLVENARSRNPAMRFILMQPARGHIHHLVYLEYVDLVFKPFSMDEIICKIRSAITQVHRHQAEEEIRRLKQEAFRIFL